MPIYRVQAPNGQILRFEGPANASQDQVLQAAKEYMTAASQPAQQPQEQPGIMQQAGEQVLGAGETALSTATGMTTGAVGMAGAAGKTIAEQILDGSFGTPEAARLAAQAAAKGADAFTYTPRTEAGRKQTEAVRDFMANVVTPLAPLAETRALGTAASQTMPAAKATATLAADKVRQAVQPAVDSVQAAAERAVGKIRANGSDAAGTNSLSAAETAAATQRTVAAQSLPEPINLTEGQRTRTFEQQRFERETAKNLELGAPLRERFSEQNAQLQHNLDAFIEQSGGNAPDTRAIGLTVDKVLRERAANDKARIRTLYKEAEKAGETAAPVDLSPVVDLLNNSRSAESTAPILTTARKELIRLGGAVGDENGNLVAVKPSSEPTPTTVEAAGTYGTSAVPKRGGATTVEARQGISLNDAEQFRKLVVKATGSDATNIKFATDIKRAFDAATEGAGGSLYKRARATRAKFARDYEEPVLIDRLLNTKSGSQDRAIALEDVLRRSVLDNSTSLDQMRQFRRLLQTKGGEEGKQAWRDIQAGTLEYIKEEATKNVARDQNGTPVLSPAKLDAVISRLDKSGKLDYVFGPKGAEQLRTLNDVAKDVLVTVPNAVNTSNTASVIAAMLDTAISGVSGVPAPVLTTFRVISKNIKDSKVKSRVARSLGETQ